MNSYSFDWLGVAVGAGLVAIVAWCITVILLKSTKRWFFSDSLTPRKEQADDSLCWGSICAETYQPT